MSFKKILNFVFGFEGNTFVFITALAILFFYLDWPLFFQLPLFTQACHLKITKFIH